MSAPARQCDATISSKNQLVAYVESGEKPVQDWRIGAEHEKFVFRADDFSPAPFDGPNGIEALLMALSEKGWNRIEENGRVIALTRNGANVTLEPGGQFELSGAPLLSTHDVKDELDDHLRDSLEAAGKLGLGFLGVGFTPDWKRDEIPWMPKQRYAIMRRYMPLKGKLGLDMMQRTSTVQVNLDYKSEADMVQKFRVSLALQPLVTAIWASSPFVEGRPTGFLSTRSQVWTDTDPDRCGILPFVFDGDMGYERYVDWVLDAPMYFVYRNGRYIDAAGQSFRAFMQGNLPALPGERPVLGDWIDHMTTVFPEVRLKKYLEMRGADSGSAERLMALPAFWAGILYHAAAQDAAWDLVKGWTAEDHAALRANAPKDGLKAKIRGGTLQDLAKEVLAIAEGGLKARALLNKEGEDETLYLEPIARIVESGRTPAEEMLGHYDGDWKRDVKKIYELHRF